VLDSGLIERVALGLRNRLIAAVRYWYYLQNTTSTAAARCTMHSPLQCKQLSQPHATHDMASISLRQRSAASAAPRSSFAAAPPPSAAAARRAAPWPPARRCIHAAAAAPYERRSASGASSMAGRAQGHRMAAVNSESAGGSRNTEGVDRLLSDFHPPPTSSRPTRKQQPGAAHTGASPADSSSRKRNGRNGGPPAAAAAMADPSFNTPPLAPPATTPTPATTTTTTSSSSSSSSSSVPPNALLAPRRRGISASPSNQHPRVLKGDLALPGGPQWSALRRHVFAAGGNEKLPSLKAVIIVEGDQDQKAVSKAVNAAVRVLGVRVCCLPLQPIALQHSFTMLQNH